MCDGGCRWCQREFTSMKDDARLRVTLLIAHRLSHPPLCWVHHFKIVPSTHSRPTQPTLGSIWCCRLCSLPAQSDRRGSRSRRRPLSHVTSDPTQPIHAFTRPNVAHRYLETLALLMQYIDPFQGLASDLTSPCDFLCMLRSFSERRPGEARRRSGRVWVLGESATLEVTGIVWGVVRVLTDSFIYPTLAITRFCLNGCPPRLIS